MDKDIYDEVFERVSSAKDFILKMMTKLFKDEDLARSNYHGGPVLCKNGAVTKIALKHDPIFKAIMAQSNLEFPDELSSSSGKKGMRDAVNGKCRKIAAKFGF